MPRSMVVRLPVSMISSSTCFCTLATETAFKLLKGERSIIVWHDYGLDPETIRWDVMGAILDGVPAEKRKHIYHISNTLCAVYLPDDFATHKLVPYETPQKYFEIEIKTHNTDN